MIAAAGLSLAIQAAPAAAGGQSAPTVVVTGRRPDRAKAIRHMTAKITSVGDASQPLPRFAEPICPSVDGLPLAMSARFAERMNEQARAAGLAIAPPGCSPNISILFVPNGQEVVRALRKSRPTMFGSLELYQINRLAADAGPVHLWSFTELRSRDDDRPRVGTSTSVDAPELQVRDASIILATTRIVVDGSVMLIDQQASVGKTINQLADYATMRVLAQARPIGAGSAAEPTILSLFDADAAPPSVMTAFDTAYLKSAYQGQPTQLPLTKVGLMARAINKSLSATVATTESDKPAR